MIQRILLKAQWKLYILEESNLRIKKHSKATGGCEMVMGCESANLYVLPNLGY